MKRVALTTAVFLLASGGLPACSSKRPITSREEPLTTRVEAVEAAAKLLAAETKAPKEARLDPAPILAINYFEGGNTLVIRDVEVAWLNRKPVCAHGPISHGQPTTEDSLNCSNEFFSSGSTCTADVASVLRFGDFREPDVPHATESVEKCAEWLLGLAYVLVVQTKEVPKKRRSDADTHYEGSAVLVNLSTGKAVGRLELKAEDKDVLGGIVERKADHDLVAVKRRALDAQGLARKAIATAMQKQFGADVSQYRLKYSDR